MIRYDRFDTALDVDNVGYVIHPILQRPVRLTIVEAAEKYHYLRNWRVRLDSLKQCAVYTDTGDETPIPTTPLRPSYSDDKSTYKPKYSMRYEEYLKSRTAENE